MEDNSGLTPLLVIVGPTAVGKSSLAMEITREIKGEIVSADSAQVYRYLDIGTAKPTPAEQEEVRHHLIDVVDPDEEFSVADYQRHADNVIAGISSEGRIPVVVGGTGLYIKSVTDRYVFSRKGKNEDLREHFNRLAEEKGTDYIYEQLKEADPESAGRIHFRDKRRIIRALEVYHTCGRSISEQWEETQSQDPLYRLFIIGLTMEREKLYERINRRTDKMLENGFREEVEGLLEKYPSSAPGFRVMGYKQLADCLEGRTTYMEAVETIKKETRNYAKRQFTWFRRDPRIEWHDAEKINLQALKEKINELFEGNRV